MVFVFNGCRVYVGDEEHSGDGWRSRGYNNVNVLSVTEWYT